MGQKYASYDATGAITGYYDDAIGMPAAGTLKLAITNDQWQTCLASQGGYVVDTAAIAIVPAPSADPAAVIATAKAAKISALRDACASALVSGFASSALGSAHAYPSTMTDQANHQSVASSAGGGLLWCADAGGTWSLVQHTQAQAQAVVSDFVALLNAYQQKLIALVAQVNAATNLAGVQAVAWGV